MNYRHLLLICVMLLSTPRLLPAAPARGREESAVVHRLSASWLAGAQRIRTAKWLILYHGQAHGSYSDDGREWIGEVVGEILLLNEHMATATPKIQLAPVNSLKVIGSSRSVVGFNLSRKQNATWRRLLTEK